MDTRLCYSLTTFCLASLFLLADPMKTWAQKGEQAIDGQHAVRLALLIGINRYKNEHLSHLPGAENDIKLAFQVLTSRFDFSPDHIHTLRNETATRDAILSTLRHLVEEATSQDMIYLHYSGHGSQVKDLDGDERTQDNDNLDETLVPYDGRTEGVPDITDDELGEILSKLKTKHAIIVIDACHSGTSTRGVAMRTRRVPQDERLELYRNGSVRTRGEVILYAKPYVLLTGAKAQEDALDVPIDGTYYGAFSHSLFRSLGSMPLTASVRDVLQGTESELKKLQELLHRTHMPEPQLEGPQDLLAHPMFPPSERNTRLQSLEVEVLDQKRILLKGGVLEGAFPGSRWALYPPGEIAFSPGKELALVMVTENQDFDAVAQIEVSHLSITQGARAVKIGSALPKGDLVLRLRDAPPEMRAKLEDALRQRGVRLAESTDFAPFVVDATSAGIHISSADGNEEVRSFSFTSAAQVADDLTAMLQRSSTVSQLLALENPSSGIKLKASVFRGDVTSRAVGVFGNLDMPIYRIRQKDEQRNHTNSLQLEIEIDQEAYLTIVDVDTEGGVNLLFPNRYSERKGFYPNGLVKGGGKLRLPDGLHSGNKAGFHWDYIPPPGRDTIRVFATTDLKLAQTIRQYVQTLIRGPERTQPESHKASLFSWSVLGELGREIFGYRERGMITVPAGSVDSHLFPSDWTAVSVSVIIE